MIKFTTNHEKAEQLKKRGNFLVDWGVYLDDIQSVPEDERDARRDDLLDFVEFINDPTIEYFEPRAKFRLIGDCYNYRGNNADNPDSLQTSTIKRIVRETMNDLSTTPVDSPKITYGQYFVTESTHADGSKFRFDRLGTSETFDEQLKILRLFGKKKKHLFKMFG
jgi:hypothetical protein